MAGAGEVAQPVIRSKTVAMSTGGSRRRSYDHGDYGRLSRRLYSGATASAGQAVVDLDVLGFQRPARRSGLEFQ